VTAAAPAYVSGGKRLNFSRKDPYTSELSESFRGFGKDEGCYPSCSWEELCALAKLVVEHPAFRLPDTTDRYYYPPTIEDSL
jgi:hypothetical protein